MHVRLLEHLKRISILVVAVIRPFGIVIRLVL
jgi:hypothetical protein